MTAERLLALEALVADLGTLYDAARRFAALEARAERELLPGLAEWSARLRRLARVAGLTDAAVADATHALVGLGIAWRTALESVRASSAYRSAVEACAGDNQGALAVLIPQVVAGVVPAAAPPTLYAVVAVTTGRRRPGQSPFLSVTECADRIDRLRAEGVTPEAGGDEWWDRELPAIGLAAEPAVLETPVALALDIRGSGVAVFQERDGSGFRVFTPRLCANAAVVLAAEATDEWWQAYDDRYEDFRDALARELEQRGWTVRVADA